MCPSDCDIHTLFVEPGNRRIQAPSGRTILAALAADGVFLRSDCGGKGLCGKCRVKIDDPNSAAATQPDQAEINSIGEESIKAGFRLACRAAVSADLAVQIPDSTLFSPEVMEKGPNLIGDVSVEVKTAADSSEPYGIAVDLGTTTIAVYLCDLVAGKIAASTSVKNPQAIFGDDVMSRISAIYDAPSELGRFQKMVVKAIEWGLLSLCRKAQITPESLKRAVVVGNSVMLHILAGKSPASIGVSPYEPEFKEARKLRAGDLGFSFHSSATVETLPLVSGFLGADIVAAALAVGLERQPAGTLLVDVGTNGEIMLRIETGFLAASCATGPAFEGASIQHGMHAVSGAIDAVYPVQIGQKPGYSVIQNDRKTKSKPSGICGTGVISATAQLLRANFLLMDGRFNGEIKSDYIRHDEHDMPEFELAPSSETETGLAVTLTQKDIRAIQLAKGALLAGIQLLCQEAGIERPTKIIVAGAFGNFINTQDALTIGMFPKIPASDVEMMGNAAGAGAVRALFDPDFAESANELIRKTRVLDLARLEIFQDVFVSSLHFPKKSA